MKSLIFPPNDGAIYYTAGRVGSYVENSCNHQKDRGTCVANVKHKMKSVKDLKQLEKNKTHVTGFSTLQEQM